MPDEHGAPTEAEKAHALGWDDDDGYEDIPDDPAPVASAPGAPAPVVTPVPQPAPDPTNDALVAWQNQMAEQQRQESVRAVEAEVKNGINVEAGRHMQQMLDGGADEATARLAAQNFATGKWAQYNLEQKTISEGALAQRDSARILAEKHGVSVSDIEMYPDVASMEAAAIRLGADRKRLTDLEGIIKNANLAPSQDFDSGASQGGGSDAMLKLEYATGQRDLTTEEFKKLFP